MKLNLHLRICLVKLLLACIVVHAPPAFSLEPLRREVGPVLVTVHSAEIPPSFFAPKESPELTFYGLRSLIVRLDVKVNGTAVVVPLDSFAGLGDPRSIEISSTRTAGRWQLRLSGGDASSSYCAILEFDRRQVREVALYRNCRAPSPFVTKKYAPVEVWN